MNFETTQSVQLIGSRK